MRSGEASPSVGSDRKTSGAVRLAAPLVLALLLACSDTTPSPAATESDAKGGTSNERTDKLRRQLEEIRAASQSPAELARVLGRGEFKEDPRTNEQLLAVVRDREGAHPDDRKEAVALLSGRVNSWIYINKDPEYVDVFAEVIRNDPDARVRRQAIISLHTAFHERTIAVLAENFDNPDPTMRFYAAEGLGFLRMGLEEAVVPHLRQALKAEDPSLVIGALCALQASAVARESLIGEAVGILRNEGASEDVLRTLMLTLIQLPGPRVAEVLAGSAPGWSRERCEWVCRWLVERGDRAARDALAGLVRLAPQPLGGEALVALLRYPHRPTGTRTLQEILQCEDLRPDTRESVEAALKELD